LRKGLSERDAISDATTHKFKGAFGNADAAHAVMNTTGAKSSLGECEAASLFAKKI
jgi:hypothetical protein